MSTAARPWLGRYAAGVPADLAPAAPTLPAAWRATVAARPDAPCLLHRDGQDTFGEIDARAGRLAAALAARGLAPGDRLGIRTQNDPAYLVALLAAWRCGAVAVACSPMLTDAELAAQLADAGARLLVAHDAPAVPGGIERLPAGELDAVAARHAAAPPPDGDPAPGDLAVLTYTSGTTGPPKGAMTSHANLAFAATVYRDWAGLGPDDVVLGIAPLFHVTGLVAHLAVTMLTGAPLVLDHRFDAARVLELVERHRCTFTVAAVTAYLAMLAEPGLEGRDLSSLAKAYTGGAPVPAAAAAEWRRRTGGRLHNVYGLTETTSPSHAVPLGADAPVDPASGALSIGVPVPSTHARIVGDDGTEVPAGTLGELAIRGPQVVAGYWGRPEETEHALPGGELRTGDVGLMDADGWFYVVDRKKDLIVASGFKVWPRDVEDVLAAHPAVREAAVVGVPDPYRGETVKAYVTLRPGAAADPDELVAFARERLAAFKAPRAVAVVDALPRTASGKLLRRELRALDSAPPPRGD